MDDPRTDAERVLDAATPLQKAGEKLFGLAEQSRAGTIEKEDLKSELIKLRDALSAVDDHLVRFVRALAGELYGRDRAPKPTLMEAVEEINRTGMFVSAGPRNCDLQGSTVEWMVTRKRTGSFRGAGKTPATALHDIRLHEVEQEKENDFDDLM